MPPSIRKVLARLIATALHRRDFEQKVFDTSYYVKLISVGSPGLRIVDVR